MKIFVLLAAFPFFVACAPGTGEKNAKQPQHFRYAGEFYPAFHPQSQIIIQTNQQVGQMKLTRAKDLKSATASDSVPLTAQDVARFYASLDSVRLLDLATTMPSVPGSDGMTVYNTITQDGKQNDFHFWSPESNSPEHKVVEAVLCLARRKFTGPRHQANLKELEQYFQPLACDVGVE